MNPIAKYFMQRALFRDETLHVMPTDKLIIIVFNLRLKFSRGHFLDIKRE